MYNKFISAITWNSINVILYKTILLLHQIILFYFIPKELYGISGTLFAALYLLIGCTNFGFEYSLFTFFAHYTQSKHSFKKLLYQCCFKVLSTVATAALLTNLLYSFAHNQIAFLFHYDIPLNLIPYLIIIFIAESIRKYTETIAQLAFLNKQITIIQISMITCYVMLVWSSYFTYGAITLNALFIPMMIVSIIETIWIFWNLYSFYETLPNSSPQPTHIIPTMTIVREQLYSYINQLSKNLFSPNFLMLLIATHMTMQQTGSIRFYTNIITLLYMLLNRSIAIPSGALLSSITFEHFEKTKQIFLTITNAYIQLLYGLAIIILTTVAPHMITHQCESQTTYIVLLFIAAGFIEYITMTYEKLYIVQQTTHQLALINASSALLFVAILYFLPLTTSLFLAPVCIIRLGTVSLIGLYAYAKWQIQPTLKISYPALTLGLIISTVLNIFIQCPTT